MNIWLMVSSILSFVLGIGHTVLGEWIGERVLVKKIQTLQLSEIEEKNLEAKKVVRLAWHATSIMWCSIGVIFLYSSFIDLNNQFIIIRILSITFLLLAVFALLTAPKKGALFLIISITSLIGTL